jgi:hypothetical protein
MPEIGFMPKVAGGRGMGIAAGPLWRTRRRHFPWFSRRIGLTKGPPDLTSNIEAFETFEANGQLPYFFWLPGASPCSYR